VLYKSITIIIIVIIIITIKGWSFPHIFSAFTLLVWQQEGHQVIKTSASKPLGM